MKKDIFYRSRPAGCFQNDAPGGAHITDKTATVPPIDGRFYFGAASSAHQVEGEQRNDWAEWERRTAHARAEKAEKKKWAPHLLERHPGPREEQNYISSRAADHWHRYEEDFDIAKKLGHNAHRISIDWSRIEPEDGKFDEKALAHYAQVVKALRERKMEPFVTLWHFTLPLWLARRGGWESSVAVERFARYVGRVVAYLKDDVTFWIPLNEPDVYTPLSYLSGRWPPQARNPVRALVVFMNLMRAHRAAYPVIKGLAPEAQVGIAKPQSHFEAVGTGQWNALLKSVADWVWNRFVLDILQNSLDFIGVNFYFHSRIKGWLDRNLNRKVSDMGWELMPESLFHVLMDLRRYGKPLYVTENGLADAEDEHREWFIEEALKALLRAKEAGADVRGYLYWALTDNFEWDDGFWPRFGLVEVDYATQERRIRKSALHYRAMIKKWPNL